MDKEAPHTPRQGVGVYDRPEPAWRSPNILIGLAVLLLIITIAAIIVFQFVI